MPHLSPRRKQLAIRLVIGAVMLCFVLVVSTVLIAVLLGYRYDGSRLEQTGLVQFDTRPSGATVEIDGAALSGRTATKTTLLPGNHEFVMWREGYETWRKTLAIEPGTLTALTYPRLIPKERQVESVATIDELTASKFTADGRFVVAQQAPTSPTFELYDLREREVKSSELTIPSAVYENTSEPDATNIFTLGAWDPGGRYLSIKHTSNGTDQWIVLDRENPDTAVNVTRLINVQFEQPVFSGTSGNVLHVLSSGDIRKIDIRAGTISRPLASSVQTFQLYDNNTIIYKNTQVIDNETRTSVGYVRENDAEPIPFTTFDADVDPSSVHISTGTYYNQQYVAYTSGNTLTVLSGSYPTAAGDATLEPYAAVDLPGPTTHLTMNQTGDVVLAQSNDMFIGFDIERKSSSDVARIAGTGQTSKLTWLDTHLLWSDRDGQLTTREFDGANEHTINQSVSGQAASLSRNGTYLYSFGRTETGELQLQRVRLVIE